MPFQKGNTARKDGITGIKKGQKQRKTIIKERIEKTLYEECAEAVDRNMREFLNSKNSQTRIISTKYFAKFFRAEKKEITGEVKMPIILDFNARIQTQQDKPKEISE